MIYTEKTFKDQSFMTKSLLVIGIIQFILFILIPDFPTTSIWIEIDAILPTASIITEKFPLLSKINNLYIVISSLIYSLLFYKIHYYHFTINKNEKNFIEIKNSKLIILFIIWIINFFLLHFDQYFFNINYFSKPLKAYRFGFIYEVKPALFIYSWLSIALNSIIFSMFFAKLLLFFKKG